MDMTTIIAQVIAVVFVIGLVLIIPVSRKKKVSAKESKRDNRIKQICTIMSSGKFVTIDDEDDCILFKYDYGDNCFISEVWDAIRAGFKTETIGWSRTVKVFI